MRHVISTVRRAVRRIAFRVGVSLWHTGAQRKPALENPSRSLHQRGKDQYRREEFEEGLETFRTLVALEPDNAAAWYYIGRIHYQGGDYVEAIAALQKSAALSPDNANALTWLARAYKRGGVAPVNGAPATRSSPALLVASSSPAADDLDELYEVARQQHSTGAYESALATWMLIARHRPSDAVPRLSAARALAKLNRMRQAVEESWAAVKLGDSSFDAHRLYAECFRELSEADAAAAKRTLKNSRDISAHVAMAKMLGDSGRHDVASDIYLGLLAITRRVEYSRSATDSLRQCGQAGRALSVVERQLAMTPAVKHLHQLHADICLKAGLPERGIPVIEQGVAAMPGERTLLTRHAKLLGAMHNWQASAQAWSSIVSLDPKSVLIRNNIAGCYRKDRQYQRAIGEYKAVLAAQPEDEVAQRGLAQCLRRLGRQHEAVDVLRSLVRTAPENFTNWDELIYALARGEELPQALEALRQAAAALSGSFGAAKKLAASAERALMFEEAEQILTQAVAESPDSLELNSELVRYYLRQGYVGTAACLLGQSTTLSASTHLLGDCLRRVQAAQRYLGHDSQNRTTTLPEDVFRLVVKQRNESEFGDFVPGRIAILTSQLSAGGAERQAVTTALGLSTWPGVDSVSLNCLSLNPALGNAFYLPMLSEKQVDVTAPVDANAEAICKHPALEAEREVLSFLPEDLRYATAAWLVELKRQRPEVVHAWQDFACMAGALAAMLANVPRIVLSTRNTRPENRYRRWKRYMAPAYQAFAQARGVVLSNNSRAGAEDYNSWLNLAAGSTAVVYNGVDFETLARDSAGMSRNEIRRSLGIPEDAPVIGGVFRLTPEKQPMVWLDAADIVARQRRDVHFILCGGGVMRDNVVQKIAELGLTDRVHAVGVQSPIAPWYRAMDMLLLASRNEGLPNVLLEAQFMGTPVVASDVGGVSEVILPNVTGWAVRDATGEKLAERLLWSLDSVDWLRNAKLEGNRYVLDNFSIDTMLKRTTELYGFTPVAQVSKAAGATL